MHEAGREIDPGLDRDQEVLRRAEIDAAGVLLRARGHGNDDGAERDRPERKAREIHLCGIELVGDGDDLRRGGRELRIVLERDGVRERRPGQQEVPLSDPGDTGLVVRIV